MILLTEPTLPDAVTPGPFFFYVLAGAWTVTQELSSTAPNAPAARRNV